MSTSVQIYRSINGAPQQNLKKAIEIAGGIEDIVGADDIVIIKPNLQWWNQGAPNIAVCAELVDCIMSRPGFTGEVILGENTHRGKEPWKTTGWNTPFIRNSDLPEIATFNALAHRLKAKYGNRFSVSHWIDVSAGGRRVYSPRDGEGYVYCDGTNGVPLLTMDNGLSGPDGRSVIMTYPIFVTDNGTTIDFKNGVWKDGAYTDQLVKLINLAALNHHSSFCGVTSSVKNYFGIVDLSNIGDESGCRKLLPEFHNFHSFAFSNEGKCIVPGIMGAEVAMFMKKIRKADLNITTAEWVGVASRTELPAAHIRVVAASTDPVALDYHMSKHVLFPNSQLRHHDPDWTGGPLHSYLTQCARVAGFAYHDSQTQVQSFDFNKGEMQTERDLDAYGKVYWGNNLKMLAKYFVFRFGSNFIL